MVVASMATSVAMPPKKVISQISAPQQLGNVVRAVSLSIAIPTPRPSPSYLPFNLHPNPAPSAPHQLVHLRLLASAMPHACLVPASPCLSPASALPRRCLNRAFAVPRPCLSLASAIMMPQPCLSLASQPASQPAGTQCAPSAPQVLFWLQN